MFWVFFQNNASIDRVPVLQPSVISHNDEFLKIYSVIRELDILLRLSAVCVCVLKMHWSHLMQYYFLEL